MVTYLTQPSHSLQLGGEDGDEKYLLTLVAHKQKETIINWEWTPVISNGIGIGIFVQVMGILVTKITYLLLAMLRQKIEDEGWGPGFVSTLMVIIGLSLFLLPPVPGVPIYFMCGLMLVEVCEPHMGGTVGATFYAVFLGLFLKVSKSMRRARRILDQLTVDFASFSLALASRKSSERTSEVASPSGRWSASTPT